MESNRQEHLRAELARMKRAIGIALAELCRINSGSPSDANAEIWEAFEWMGGDGDALSRQIDFISQLKKASGNRPAAGGAR
jgi:hypothetical protein